MASGGEMTPGSRSWAPQYSLTELRAAVDEAHRHGLPITVHAHAEEAIRRSIEAGVDMIEHCTLMTVNGVSSNRELIRTIAHAGIPVSITTGYRPGRPLPQERALDRMRSVMHNVNLMREAGVRIICSSDAGVSAHKPHGMLPFSVQTFVDAGFTHYEALCAVTSIAAEACGLGTRKGCLIAGYDADLLAVGGNPLEDIGALLNVIAVFRMGQRIR
jgi:imidazolonepropionase-like amidohydrolase